MRASAIFQRCRADSKFLVRRYFVETLQLLAVVGMLTWLRWTSFVSFELVPAHGLAVVVAIPFGWFVASLVHNAGHTNFPVRFNRAIGEFAGAYLGYGFTSFVLIHTLHHSHTDRQHDPVSPRGLTFWQYLISPLRHPTRIARAYLQSVHGGSSGYGTVRLGEFIAFNTNVLLRVAMWALLFGPELFLFFYIPSIISDVAILAHINYACHRDRDDGSVEIVNLTGNLYYDVANAVTMGGYFHKNHHLQPKLIDPRAVDERAEPMLSIPPQERPCRVATAGEPIGVLGRYFDLGGIWGESSRPR